jgi:inosine-uridine nucleoside N-ribohydrolase
MKVMLDMDVGVDDAVALMVALNSRELDVIALSSVGGNVSARIAAINALRVMEAIGKRVPVIKGLNVKHYRRDKHSIDIHGRDGLGDINLPMPEGRYVAGEPIRSMVDAIMKSGDKVTLICTGPLTNAARLLQSNARDRIERIFLMGGVYHGSGNVTRDAEFNFYTDAAAADDVMNSKISIVTCGLDVTTKQDCVIDSYMLDRMRGIDSVSARLAVRLLEERVSRMGYFHLHDVFAVLAAVRDDIFVKERAMVRVVRSGRGKGRCMVEHTEGGNVHICIDVKSDEFKDILLDRLVDSIN